LKKSKISFGDFPKAYKPPTIAPALVPAIISGEMFLSSKNCRTPASEIPLVPPPDNTKPIFFPSIY
jgi:hypothetical protein